MPDVTIVLENRNGLLVAEFCDALGEWTYFGEIQGRLNPDKRLAIGVGSDLAWLDRSTCDALWPLMKRFADTGSLAQGLENAERIN